MLTLRWPLRGVLEIEFGRDGHWQAHTLKKFGAKCRQWSRQACYQRAKLLSSDCCRNLLLPTTSGLFQLRAHAPPPTAYIDDTIPLDLAGCASGTLRPRS